LQTEIAWVLLIFGLVSFEFHHSLRFILCLDHHLSIIFIIHLSNMGGCVAGQKKDAVLNNKPEGEERKSKDAAVPQPYHQNEPNRQIDPPPHPELNTHSPIIENHHK
jgi:hypothetical protein